MQTLDWSLIYPYIVQMEQENYVTRTFRRLDASRQQAIVYAILDEATEKGPAALNIKQVAQRASVSVGSLYTYFNDRDGLLNFAVELCVRFVTDSFNSYRSLLASLPIRTALQAYMVGGIEWSQTFAGLIRLFARAAYRGEPEWAESLVTPVTSSLRAIIHEMLVEGIRRGEIRPDIDLEATERVLHALTLAVGDSQLLPYLNTYFQIVGDDVSPERTLTAMIEMVLNGIGTGKDLSESS